MLSRIVSSTDQIVPNFSGFFVKSAGKADDLQKTKYFVMLFLQSQMAMCQIHLHHLLKLENNYCRRMLN